MRERGVTCNVVTYNTMVKGLCRKMRGVEAERLVNETKRAGLNPSLITCNTKEMGFLMLENQASSFFNEMRSYGLSPSLFGRWRREAFVLESDVYTIIIDAFLRSNNLEKAFEVFSCMEKAGLVANSSTYGVLIHGWCARGNMKEASNLFKSMRNMHLKLM
ncbi:LOW QUALITY PROTEIN: hypothetical protein RJ639_043997 [Escallonia herrerae]|uniref:Pentatricopeptide repeat-containing protein n=1 Tax=Escallonia herrerae TaxID=1293975 RepID=A0AA89B7X9_9ASTE|nr:LOW QUALITY PROTEIN: hypothetical protein RJ639_043997 [Escallonia herrerae]